MASPSQRSVPHVLQDILGNLEEIVRSEFRLAKKEIKGEAGRAAKPAATFGVGLVLSFYAGGFLLLAAVYGLSIVVPAWIAAMLVGLILALVAAVLLNSGGKKLRRVNLSPDRAIQSLEEDIQWAKQRLR